MSTIQTAVAPGVADAASPNDGGTDRAQYRPEIEGLRAVAVLLIVGYHVLLPGFGGGFIGVDVFFVISGYLITQILLRWLDPRHVVSPRAFWARRVRRLVPALGVVTVSVLLFGVFVVYSPLAWRNVTRDAAASSLYLSNIFFARQATDYFAPAVTTSPFLHTWSLGVEEQFYLVWPLLFLVPAVMARSSLERGRRALVAILATVTAGSFVLSLRLSARGTPWAFFSSPTRAWEFGCAGLLAVVASRERVASRMLSFAAWLGLATIIVAAVKLGQSQPYPGRAALIPVLGTMAVLVPNLDGERWGPAVLLRQGPLRWIGRVSYSWYLWHWPLIVFAQVLVRGAGTGVRLAAALVALGLAALTRSYVEDPVRFNHRLVESARRSLLVGGAITAVVLLAVGGVAYAGKVARHDPLMRRLAATRHWSGHARCKRVRGACVYGDASSPRVIVLAGDSHAAQWLPAIDAVARTFGDRLLLRSRGDCPLVPVRIADALTGRASRSCERFRSKSLLLIRQVHPAAVVVGMYSGYDGRVLGSGGNVLGKQDEERAWREGYAALARTLAAEHVPVVFALDDPALSFDPIECMARHRSVHACTPSRRSALRFTGPFNEAVRAGVADAGYGELYDPTSVICDATRCRLLIGNTLVFADNGHVTHQFSISQVRTWATLIRSANVKSRR
jgi:peptidoglycan/LPS O-acetylase OafA/YrhL